MAGVLASFAFLPWATAAFATALGWLAIFIAVVDIDHRIIPDLANIAVLVIGLAFILVQEWPFHPSAALLDAFARAATVGGLLYALRAFYWRINGVEGLGLGDVKLTVAGAPFLSWQALPLAIALAALACALAVAARIVVRGETFDREFQLPFGAFLAPAIWLMFVLTNSGLFLA